jgi:hypothetical protein
MISCSTKSGCVSLYKIPEYEKKRNINSIDTLVDIMCLCTCVSMKAVYLTVPMLHGVIYVDYNAASRGILLSLGKYHHSKMPNLYHDMMLGVCSIVINNFIVMILS